MAFQYSAQTVTKKKKNNNNGSIVDSFCQRENKTQQIKKWQRVFQSVSLNVWQVWKKHLFQGLFRQWSLPPLLKNVPASCQCAALFFPRLVGQEFISPACHWVSQRRGRKKRWMLKQHVPPRHASRQHVISHHSSGLLLQIQQRAQPGPRGRRDRWQTRDGWHTTRTLTASPFRLFVPACLPYKMQSRWCMLQVAEDCTAGCDMHLFACLARWQQLQTDCCYNQTLLNQYCKAPSLQWQRYITSNAKQCHSMYVKFNHDSVCMTLRAIQTHRTEREIKT